MDDSSNLVAEALSANEPATQEAVKFPYLMLAATLFVLATLFARLKLPAINHRQSTQQPGDVQRRDASAWQHRHLLLGAVGIFVYVGAEVGIGSFLVNFIGDGAIAGMAEADAAHYVTYYFGGAMVGRFIGAAAMQKIAAGRALAFNAVCACLLVSTAILMSGALAMWAILLVGLCNSIMFPTLFTLAIARLGRHTSQGSGILCLAIVGGAILPLLQGMLADQIGVQLAFIIPLLCYVYIAYYGMSGYQPLIHQNDDSYEKK